MAENVLQAFLFIDGEYVGSKMLSSKYCAIDDIAIGRYTIKFRQLQPAEAIPFATDLAQTVEEVGPQLPQPEQALFRAPQTTPVLASPVRELAPNDDEDEDPDDQPAPFSLLQNLATQGYRQAGIAQQREPVLEVIQYQGDTVLEFTQLKRGRAFRIGQRLLKKEARRLGVPVNFRLALLRKDGLVEVGLLPDFRGTAAIGGKQKMLQNATEAELHRLRLGEGDHLHLTAGAQGYYLRMARPPALQTAITRPGSPTLEQRQQQRSTLASLGSSLAVHMVVLLSLFVVGMVSPPPIITELDPDRFVQMPVTLELEKPTQPEPVEETVEESVLSPEVKPQPTRAKHLTHHSGKNKKPGLLAALGKIPKRPGAAGGQTLTAAVSNLHAVKNHSGGAGYRVSGLTGAGPTDRVQIGGAGGGVATKGLNTILREGGGGVGTLGQLRNRPVRGKVVASSRGAKPRGTAHLSRVEIQKVVNRGLGKIQFCYEKELLKKHSLSGKVTFEWTINSRGRVTIVKTKTSTLKSARAIGCMIQNIKRWKFPHPKGVGNVIVTYPFVFHTTGY